jgi:hypothetical protein
MIQNVGKSIEAQDMKRKDYEAQIKAFDAETKRISTVQASMSPEQIQDIVMGTLHGAITSGDIVSPLMLSENDDNIPETEPQEMNYASSGINPNTGA